MNHSNVIHSNVVNFNNSDSWRAVKETISQLVRSIVETANQHNVFSFESRYTLGMVDINVLIYLASLLSIHLFACHGHALSRVCVLSVSDESRMSTSKM